MVEAIRVCPNCRGKLTLFSTDTTRVRYYCRKCKSFVSTLRQLKAPVAFLRKSKPRRSKPSVAKKKVKKQREKKKARVERERLCTGCGRKILPSDKYCPFCGKQQG